MFMKKKLFTLGLAAVSFLPVMAQESVSDSIPATDTVLVVPPDEQEFDFNFESWPSNEEFVARLANHPNVIIDTFFVKSLQEMNDIIYSTSKPFYIAYYNPIKDNIHLSYLDNRGASLTNYHGVDNRENVINSIIMLKDKAKSIKANMVGVFVHEWKHLKNRKLIALRGLTVSQIAQVQVHDEITAQIEELLFRRNIYTKTKSISQAETGVESWGIRTINGKSCYGDYMKYLKNNSDTLQTVPLPDEMDLIIKVAILNFLSDQLQYEENIIRISQWKIVQAHREYIQPDTIVATPTDSCSFDDKIKAMYQFGDLNALELCSEIGRWQILKCVKDFYNIRSVRKKLEYLEIGYAEINSHADKYLTDNRITNSEVLDTKQLPKDFKKPKFKKEKQR